MTSVPAAFALSNVNKTHMVVSALDFRSTQFVLFTFDERDVLSTVSKRNNNKNKEIDYRAIAIRHVYGWFVCTVQYVFAYRNAADDQCITHNGQWPAQQ